MELSPQEAPPDARIALPARLSWDEVDRLHERVRAVRRGTLTLEGTGGVFCEGGAFDPTAAEEPRPERFAALLRAIEEAPVVVLAVVDGPALGAGAGLAAAADLVIATPRARFGLPETVMGLVPAMVFPVLARRLGVARARRLALGCAAFTAEQALAAGLADEIADDGEAAAARARRRLSRQDPEAVAALKALVARHFAATAEYESAAADALRARWHSAATRRRLQRYADGGAPWDEE